MKWELEPRSCVTEFSVLSAPKKKPPTAPTNEKAVLV